ncbi:hypothetical protein ACP4OV_024614 [Aristida adscensionis]
MSTPAPAEAAQPDLTAEYARSGRSTCKGCGEAIACGALRLGASARDPRGFDSTRWYHVECFPAASLPLGPVESLNGFDTIKDEDREKLRELEKNCKKDQTAVAPLEEPSPNKVKTQMASPAEGAPDKPSLSVEYAKSGRSTCKGCGENIVKDALRLGASVHDPRGFENTKWYHVVCFPVSSYQVFPVDNLKGFDSIKDHDREKLLELEENHRRGNNGANQLCEPDLKKETAQSTGNSKEGAEKDIGEAKQFPTCLFAMKNHERDEAAVDPLDEPSPKKVKALVSSPAKGVSEKESIIVEYAKSGRSTCKGCSENIANAALRLGVSSYDPRGFDRTKWYHVACFPVSSYPLFSVENLKGFDSIENHDREKLQELEQDHKRDGNVVDQ